MPNKPLPMKLSREEDSFLRHWIRDEWRYRDGQGSAKQLQVLHGAVPADLAVLIAAAFPDPDDQNSIAINETSATAPVWPWTAESLAKRVATAREYLAKQQSAEAMFAEE